MTGCRCTNMLLLAAIIGGLAVSGCSSGSPPAPAVERRDSAGIEIVLSRAATWDGDARWQLSDAPTVSIGEMEGRIPYLLSRVVGATELSDGRIVVGNGGTNELRFYDSSGMFLQTIGREGQGPGEFEYLRAIRHCSSDSIFAFDLSWQLSMFDLSGEFLRSLRLVMPGTDRTPYSLSCGLSGRLLLASWGAETLRGIIGFYRTTASLMLVDADSKLLHDFGQFPGAERIGTERGSRPHPFGKALVHAMGPSAIYVGTGDTYDIHVFDTDGALGRIIRWMGADLAITPEALDAYQEMRLAQVDPARRPGVERELREMPFPDTRPAYSALRLDPDGNLWVRGFSAPGSDPAVWTVFGPTGIMLGEITLPSRFEVFEIGRDYVLGVHHDELDVERVQQYSILKPDHPA